MRLTNRTADHERNRAGTFVLERDGVRLAGLDYGGRGPAVLLLHGLAGHAGEWAETASWLTRHHRVVAFDARGHGASERDPGDVSRTAHVEDAAYVVRAMRLEPVIVVGQSLGGQTALLLASRRGDLVRAAVVAEASPAGGGAKAGIEAEVMHLGASLQRWPVPFPSRTAAVTWFGGPSVRADAWFEGLEHRDGGWWPRFDVVVMQRTLREAASRDYWDEWQHIARPTLVVRAEGGYLRPADAQRMVERGQDVRLVEVPGAGHDVHLDAPARWREAVEPFLGGLR
jgi:pimeloyl-ACP methyl ester carboxylesterase